MNTNLSPSDALVSNDYIIISDHQTKHVIPIRNIIRLESRRVYTIIYTRNKQQLVCSRNLKVVSAELPPDLFFRIHKSHVVNMTELKAYHPGRGGQVILNDDTVIDVAQRKKTAFLRQFRAMARPAQTHLLRKNCDD